MVLDLHGIKLIRVQATDIPASGKLDAPELANEIAVQITSRGWESGVKGFTTAQASNEDGALRVAVLEKSATPGPKASNGKVETWEFRIKISAVLTDKNGAVVWRESSGDYHFSHLFPQQQEADLWKQHAVQNWLNFAVSNRLVFRMMNGN